MRNRWINIMPLFELPTCVTHSSQLSLVLAFSKWVGVTYLWPAYWWSSQWPQITIWYMNQKEFGSISLEVEQIVSLLAGSIPRSDWSQSSEITELEIVELWSRFRSKHTWVRKNARQDQTYFRLSVSLSRLLWPPRVHEQSWNGRSLLLGASGSSV